MKHKFGDVEEKVEKALLSKQKKDHKLKDEHVMLKKANLLSWKDADCIGSIKIKASCLKMDERKPIDKKPFVGRFYTIEKEGKITGKLLMIMKLWKISKLERDGDSEA